MQSKNCCKVMQKSSPSQLQSMPSLSSVQKSTTSYLFLRKRFGIGPNFAYSSKDHPTGLKFGRSEDALSCRNNGSAFPIRASKLHYKELCEPIQVLNFDFQTFPEGKTVEIEGEVEIQDVQEHIVPKYSKGKSNAVLFWWDICLADGVHLTTAPKTNWWQDHWLQV
jgi:hypothetical protein